MNRKEGSRSRYASGIRKHNRINESLIGDKDYVSSSDSSNKPLKYSRKQYSLFEKYKIIEQYKEIKAKYLLKGIKAISNELIILKIV